MHFTLASVLVFIAVVAVACAALVNPTNTWAAGAHAACLILLFGSLLCAIYRQGIRRAFYCGFTIFGWGYLVVVFGPVKVDRYDDVDRLDHDGLLATTRLLNHFCAAINEKVIMISDGRIAYVSVSGPGGHIEYENFMTIGHALCALIFAALGGIVATYLYSTSRRESP